MDCQVTRLPKSRVRLVIQVSAEEMAVFFASAYQELGEGVEIGGFRRGKAPKTLLRERLGASRVIAAAIDLAVPDAYQQALDTQQIIAVSEPAIEINQAGEDEPLVYTAQVDILPSVSVGRYQKVRVSAKKYAAEPVKPEAVTEAITNLRRRLATPKPVLRPAAQGDWVEVSYVGKVKGVVQAGLQSQHHPLVLGEGTFLPAFEEQLIGLSQGEQRTFTLDLPAGQAGVPHDKNESRLTEFSVTLDAVSELIIPELTDELAKKFNKTSVAEVTRATQDDLAIHAENAARNRLEQAVLTAVDKEAKVDLPESLIEREVDRRLRVLADQLEKAGHNLTAWLADQKKDLITFRTEIRPAAEQAVRTSLVLRAIAEQEGFIQPGQSATEDSLKKTVEFLVTSATQ